MAAPLVKPLLCPILIGRAPYLAALQECVDEACTGHGRAILVTSEAGIGKSRLVAEAATYASGCSFVFLTGHCFEQDQAVPYAPLLEILRSALRERYGMSAAESLKPFASEVIRLMPEFADVFATIARSEPDVAYEPERQKSRFLWHLRWSSPRSPIASPSCFLSKICSGATRPASMRSSTWPGTSPLAHYF